MKIDRADLHKISKVGVSIDTRIGKHPVVRRTITSVTTTYDLPSPLQQSICTYKYSKYNYKLRSYKNYNNTK